MPTRKQAKARKRTARIVTRTVQKGNRLIVLDPKAHYRSPRWSGEITDCSMPMTFDQYGKCSYDCFYCFAAFQKAVGQGRATYLDNELVTAVDVRRVKKTFTEQWPNNQFQTYVAERHPMQWGGLADPFCEYERMFGVGLELMRFFKELNYPLRFSTKATWWTEDPRYVELFQGQKNWNVMISIITMDEHKARVAERRCPSVRKRLEAMERVAGWDSGGVTLRLRPFIIGISNPTHEELILEAGKRGAQALSTEFFCVEQRSNALKARMPEINRLLGFDMMKFYKRYSYSLGYWRLNRNVKRRYVDEMEAACRQAGMRFYVSDAHFKERCDGGSCCGLPESWNYCRGQWTSVLKIAQSRKSGKVFWKDIEPHLKYASWLYRKSEGLNTKGSMHRAEFHNFTMKDFLRWIWNHPDASGQSPYRMFEGILTPVSVDSNGNVVYQYTKERE